MTGGSQHYEFAIENLEIEDWQLRQPFVISRGAKTHAKVVHLQLTANGKTGHGEAVPYARYDETPPQTIDQIRKAPTHSDRQFLNRSMPPGAARNAIDCALWDLECKIKGIPAHALAGLPQPQAVETCFTISLGSPEAMATAAKQAGGLNLLKLKLGGGQQDADRMQAVRAARPDARLVADANEAWCASDITSLLNEAARQNFELIEQPLPECDDALLAEIDHPVAICADESTHTTADLSALRSRYDAVNIKLDKTGGLTEALAMRVEAHRLGFKIMVGSMVATSLAVAPAILLAQDAQWVDLDGPLLLAGDRNHGLQIQRGWIEPPSPELWG